MRINTHGLTDLFFRVLTGFTATIFAIVLIVSTFGVYGILFNGWRPETQTGFIDMLNGLMRIWFVSMLLFFLMEPRVSVRTDRELPAAG